LIAGGVLAVVAVLGLVAGYAYYFTGIRTAPKPLALSTPSPAASTSASPAATTRLAGTWSVASGAIAGYRVNEKFAGQTSSHEAVAQTSSVTGTLTVGGSAGALQAGGISVVADLGSLQCFWYGAAPMSTTRLKEAMQTFGPVMAQLFGQSEAPMMISTP